MLRGEAGFWSVLLLALSVGIMLSAPAQAAGHWLIVAGVGVAGGVCLMFVAFFGER